MFYCEDQWGYCVRLAVVAAFYIPLPTVMVFFSNGFPSYSVDILSITYFVSPRKGTVRYTLKADEGSSGWMRIFLIVLYDAVLCSKQTICEACGQATKVLVMMGVLQKDDIWQLIHRIWIFQFWNARIREFQFWNKKMHEISHFKKPSVKDKTKIQKESEVVI